MKHKNTVGIHIQRTREAYKTTRAEADKEALRRRAEERMARDEEARINREAMEIML